METRVNQNSLAAYLAHIERSYTGNATGKSRLFAKTEFGQKYIRVVIEYMGRRECHSFIVDKPDEIFSTGTILKAAQWKAPAVNFARGHIDDPNSYKLHTWMGGF